MQLEPATSRLKRFVYLSSYDELFCKSLREQEAYKVMYGKKEEAFEANFRTFITSVSVEVFATYEKKIIKLIRDQYMRLEESRLETVRDMEPLSGDLETVFAIDVLLNDLIHEKNEFGESRRVKRDEQTVRK